MQTGTYSAQYGSYLGVHINAVSKTGGNAFHGGLTESVRNESSTPTAVLMPGPKNPLRQNQFGAEVDGPVVLPSCTTAETRPSSCLTIRDGVSTPRARESTQ